MFESLSTLFRYIGDLFRWWVLVMPWERGIRVRCGKWMRNLGPGIHLRIPYIDSAYVQTVRLRVVPIPMQTIQTKDGKPLTIVAVLGYRIVDMRMVYETLYHPESTVVNLVMASIAKFVSSKDFADCSPAGIADFAMADVQLGQYGFDAGSVEVVGYATVKTFRLIQAYHYTDASDTIDVDQKR